MKWFPDYNYILGSKSPRRKQLLKSIGIDFKVIALEVDENYPRHLAKEEIPVYLAETKAKPHLPNLKAKDLLITADTIVWLNGRVLGKPLDKDDAVSMLTELSGKKHQVISGVCLTSLNKQISFFSSTNVRFVNLTSDEIDFYVSEFQPFDKAGAYGIQEWIGSIGISHIEGSFYNVMGLPIQQLYFQIQKFENHS